MRVFILIIALATLTLSASVFLTHSPQGFPTSTNFLGWWFNNGTHWVPAVNLEISDGQRVAVMLPGADGSLILSIGNFLSNTTHYDFILGIRYNTQQVDAAIVIATKLSELYDLRRVDVDVWGISQGAIMARYIMEVLDYGEKRQTANVVLLAITSQGLLTHLADFENSNGSLATNISNGIVSALVAGSLLTTPQAVLNNLYYRFKGNSEQNSVYAGAGNFIKDLNVNCVSDKTFERLRYYAFNGFRFDNQFPVTLLQIIFGTANPYAFIGQLVFGITDNATLNILKEWEVTFPSQGLLGNYGWKLARNPYHLIYDGLLTAQNDILGQKSRFFFESRTSAEIFVPVSHANGGILTPAWIETYINVIDSFKYEL